MSYKYIFIIFYLLIPVCGFSDDVSSENINIDSLKSEWVIKTADDAIALALKYTGFAKYMIQEPSFENNNLHVFHFISKKCGMWAEEVQRCNHLWVVRFDGVDARKESAIQQGLPDDFRRNFCIVMNPISGALVLIFTVKDEIEKNSDYIKYFEDKILSMIAVINLSYDIPAINPITDFKKAMSAAICPIMNAEDIIGQFVFPGNYDRNVNEPLWLITCTNAPVWGGLGGGRAHASSINRRGFAQCGIDDKTGKCKFTEGTNVDSGFKR